MTKIELTLTDVERDKLLLCVSSWCDNREYRESWQSEEMKVLTAKVISAVAYEMQSKEKAE